MRRAESFATWRLPRQLACERRLVPRRATRLPYTTTIPKPPAPRHTAIIKGYVQNPGQRLRAGQYITVTADITPPADLVEIPVEAIVDDGGQSLVYVQTDPDRHR